MQIFFVHGISYRPTDLSSFKEFSKKISFKDFHNFIWTRLSRSSGSCPSLSLQSYAANAASMQPQGRYVNCKLGTYWGFRGQPKSAQIVQIVQTSTQVVLTLKYNLFLGILLPKLFWPTVRKKCSRNPEKPFDVRGWRLRICNILEITTLYFSTKHKKLLK